MFLVTVMDNQMEKKTEDDMEKIVPGSHKAYHPLPQRNLTLIIPIPSKSKDVQGKSKFLEPKPGCLKKKLCSQGATSGQSSPYYKDLGRGVWSLALRVWHQGLGFGLRV